MSELRRKRRAQRRSYLWLRDSRVFFRVSKGSVEQRRRSQSIRILRYLH